MVFLATDEPIFFAFVLLCAAGAACARAIGRTSSWGRGGGYFFRERRL